MKKNAILFIGLLLSFYSEIHAQLQIKESDLLFKKRIIRSLNLSSPPNQALFGKENLLAAVLFDAYEAGSLKGYKTNSCEDTLSYAGFEEKICAGTDSLIGFSYGWLNVELGEDLVVDKHRSEISFDMETLTLMLPEMYNRKGLLEPLVTFKFDDCQRIFKNDKRAIAINPLMNGRNINYYEVFLLRLFSSRIVKIGDDNDLYFDQMYAGELQAFLEGKKQENALSEYLYKLFHPE